MSLRWAMSSLLALSLSAPAAAMEVTWRATGTVDSLQGTTALLPLPASVGDLFLLQFTYDDAALDESPANANSGSYPILSLGITIAGNSLQIVSPGSGEGHIGIQANSIDPNLWGVNGCIAPCDLSDFDSARLNFFFPANTILSDALTDPPGPSARTFNSACSLANPGARAGGSLVGADGAGGARVLPPIRARSLNVSGAGGE